MKLTDKIELFNEDNIAGMARYPDEYFDLAIVDPPYGFKTDKTGILNFRMQGVEKQWNIAPTIDYFDELKRVSKNQIVWGGNYFPELWVNGCRCFIYWHKGNPVPNFSDGELAWTSFNQNAKQFDFKYYGNIEGKTSASEKVHPTQKPIALYNWILSQYAQPNFKILDTHLGSGSIAIACHQYGCELTGFEIDSEYFNAAIHRFQMQTNPEYAIAHKVKTTGQQDLFFKGEAA